jgi:hypothetical protein
MQPILLAHRQGTSRRKGWNSKCEQEKQFGVACKDSFVDSCKLQIIAVFHYTEQRSQTWHEVVSRLEMSVVSAAQSLSYGVCSMGNGHH